MQEETPSMKTLLSIEWEAKFFDHFSKTAKKVDEKRVKQSFCKLMRTTF